MMAPVRTHRPTYPVKSTVTDDWVFWLIELPIFIAPWCMMIAAYMAIMVVGAL